MTRFANVLGISLDDLVGRKEDEEVAWDTVTLVGERRPPPWGR